jgi:seryl-tRNA synthetase
MESRSFRPRRASRQAKPAFERTQCRAAKANKEEIKKKEQEAAEFENQRKAIWVQLPTIPSPDTPIGKDDSENVEVYRWGEIPKFDFTPKDHIQLGKNLDILDLERGAKVAGYRGYYLKNDGAKLAMALMCYVLNKMWEKGYSPMIPPTLVKEFALFGSGYFKGTEYDPETDEIYQVSTSDKEASGAVSGEKKFLVGTAEPSLLAYFSGETLEEKDLPLRLSGFSQCYRSEIGSYGKDTKGLYRVHEFMKVEQVVLSPADIGTSDKLQEEMVSITKEIQEELQLPYRVLRICSGDLGLGKYKQFDYEVWMPGMNRWGETGSASNFVDWQARRLNVKYKTGTGEKKYVYMLNNTAMPTPRPLIAIMENFQTKEGEIRVPKVLWKYGAPEIIRKS